MMVLHVRDILIWWLNAVGLRRLLGIVRALRNKWHALERISLCGGKQEREEGEREW